MKKENAILNRVEEAIRIKGATFGGEQGPYARLNFLEKLKREFKGPGKHLTAAEILSLEKVAKEIREIVLRRGKKTPFNIKLPGLLGKKAADWLGKNKSELPLPAIDGSYQIADLQQRVLKEKGAELNHLDYSLMSNGFYGFFDNRESAGIYTNDAKLQVERNCMISGDTMKFKLDYERSDDSGMYFPTAMEATLRKEIAITGPEKIGEVSLVELENKMQRINWQIDFLDIGSAKPADAQGMHLVEQVFTDLLRLMNTDHPEAKKLHDLLAFKYMVDTPNEKMLPDAAALKAQYEIRASVAVGLHTPVADTPMRMYNLMNHRAVQGGWETPDDKRWYQVDFSKKERDGTYGVKAIEGSEYYLLEAALLKSSVKAFGDYKEVDPVDILRNGGSVRAVMDKDGEEVVRMIMANPSQGTVSIDWIQSAELGLLGKAHPTVDAYHAQIKDRVMSKTGGNDALQKAPEINHATGLKR